MTEYSFNTFWNLSYGRNTGQKIAISNVPLLNISRINRVSYDLSIRDNISDSFPFNFPVIYFKIKGSFVRWEGSVGEFFILLFA
jgi:hypothetical protein